VEQAAVQVRLQLMAPTELLIVVTVAKVVDQIPVILPKAVTVVLV
jgi:hypothetical protein